MAKFSALMLLQEKEGERTCKTFTAKYCPYQTKIWIFCCINCSYRAWKKTELLFNFFMIYSDFLYLIRITYFVLSLCPIIKTKTKTKDHFPVVKHLSFLKIVLPFIFKYFISFLLNENQLAFSGTPDPVLIKWLNLLWKLFLRFLY